MSDPSSDRNSLAAQYRARGAHEKADALFADTGICEHLRPVQEHIRAQGGRITFAGQAWSSNCRRWVYFDMILDAASLKKRFALPDIVTVHEHVGTHDGAEQGLVCNEHQDAVMGPHPSMSGAKVVG
jgi:hypothetical protein